MSCNFISKTLNWIVRQLNESSGSMVGLYAKIDNSKTVELIEAIFVGTIKDSENLIVTLPNMWISVT